MLTEQIVENVKLLVGQIQSKQWELGDYLNSQEVKLAEDEMAKLAEMVGLSLASIRLYERVAREVPAVRRDSRISYDVYKFALAIKNPEDRWAVIDSRSEWTVAAIKAQVREWQKKNNVKAGTAGATSIYKAGMKLENNRIVASLDPDAHILKISGSVPAGINEEDTKLVFLTETEFVLIVKLAD